MPQSTSLPRLPRPLPALSLCPLLKTGLTRFAIGMRSLPPLQSLPHNFSHLPSLITAHPSPITITPLPSPPPSPLPLPSPKPPSPLSPSPPQKHALKSLQHPIHPQSPNQKRRHRDHGTYSGLIVRQVPNGKKSPPPSHTQRSSGGAPTKKTGNPDPKPHHPTS